MHFWLRRNTLSYIMNAEKHNEIKMRQAIENKHWEQDEDDFLSSTAISISGTNLSFKSLQKTM